jgi:hypothetical protein
VAWGCHSEANTDSTASTRRRGRRVDVEHRSVQAGERRVGEVLDRRRRADRQPVPGSDPPAQVDHRRACGSGRGGPRRTPGRSRRRRTRAGRQPAMSAAGPGWAATPGRLGRDHAGLGNANSPADQPVERGTLAAERRRIGARAVEHDGERCRRGGSRVGVRFGVDRGERSLPPDPRWSGWSVSANPSRYALIARSATASIGSPPSAAWSRSQATRSRRIGTAGRRPDSRARRSSCSANAIANTARKSHSRLTMPSITPTASTNELMSRTARLSVVGAMARASPPRCDSTSRDAVVVGLQAIRAGTRRASCSRRSGPAVHPAGVRRHTGRPRRRGEARSRRNRLGCQDRGDHRPQRIGAFGDLVAQGNEIQLTDRAFRRELLSWIRFNPATALRSGDGLAGRCTGNPSLPTWLGKLLAPVVIRARPRSSATPSTSAARQESPW